MDFWVKILSDIYNNSGEYAVNQKEPSLISFFLTHQLDGYFSTLYIDECTYRYISLNTIVFCEWIIFHSSSKKRQTIEDPQQCGGFKICSNTSLMNQGLRKKCQAKPWKKQIFPEWIIQFPSRIIHASCIYIPESMSNSCWMVFRIIRWNRRIHYIHDIRDIHDIHDIHDMHVM